MNIFHVRKYTSTTLFVVTAWNCIVWMHQNEFLYQVHSVVYRCCHYNNPAMTVLSLNVYAPLQLTFLNWNYWGKNYTHFKAESCTLPNCPLKCYSNLHSFQQWMRAEEGLGSPEVYKVFIENWTYYEMCVYSWQLLADKVTEYIFLSLPSYIQCFMLNHKYGSFTFDFLERKWIQIHVFC